MHVEMLATQLLLYSNNKFQVQTDNDNCLTESFQSKLLPLFSVGFFFVATKVSTIKTFCYEIVVNVLLFPISISNTEC